ncbi:MAG TPA: hypothetical protein VNE41_08660 [Chitinophagaceae bacterium]|nr:hypothetical protein [Chitinophagaceae bacterium]
MTITAHSADYNMVGHEGLCSGNIHYLEDLLVALFSSMKAMTVYAAIFPLMFRYMISHLIIKHG